ncbi:MAG: hypothetical protein JNK75_09465 [Betaproteobacteria bacterium]|nr:hypothetical protein [Betaproteobacteria bacterium]
MPASPATLSPPEFLAVVRGYAEACRAHDARLLVWFGLALFAALEVVAGGFLFLDANVLANFGQIGPFARAWTALSLAAAVGLAVYILATSSRFHRNSVPRCPRCTVSIRNLDDFLMAMSLPAPVGHMAASVRCDVCEHGIADWNAGAFRAS